MLKKTESKPSLFATLGDMLNPNHPLVSLANKIDWDLFENSFGPLYSSTKGRPCIPIRLMCGLLILKHVRNISDESVVEQWSESPFLKASTLPLLTTDYESSTVAMCSNTGIIF